MKNDIKDKEKMKILTNKLCDVLDTTIRRH